MRIIIVSGKPQTESSKTKLEQSEFHMKVNCN